MLDRLVSLGNKSLRLAQNYLINLGGSGIFLIQVLFSRVKFARVMSDFKQQLYFVGVLSCLIITVSGLFVGMVIALQGYIILQKFGASSQLGQLVALSITRELGPVMSALLFAGRAGSAITAEIGLMKTTEQLLSMDMMGVDPLGRIICPRFLAGFISMPLLALLFSVVAIFGGYFVAVLEGVDAGSFWSNMQAAVNLQTDVASGVLKSIVFAFTVTWIAVFQGFFCRPTAEGVAKATTRTVVYSSLAVLGLDFILTFGYAGVR